MGRRLRIAGLVVLAVVLLTAVSSAAGGGGQPDLVADRAQRLSLGTYDVAGQQRLLLRFDGFIHNAGTTAWRVEASDPADSPVPGAVREMRSVVQRLGTGTGVSVPAARMLFEPGDGHQHWHLRDAARYTLVDDAGAAVAPAQKVGFCLMDSERVSGSHPGVPPEGDECGAPGPEDDAVAMEISPGWRDVYRAELAYQWVDVSDVQPGVYRLRTEVDPDELFVEQDEANPPAHTTAVVPGYLPEPATSGRPEPGGSATLRLTARAAGLEGTPEARPQFRIDEPPRHGRIDAPVAEWRSAEEVRYTADDTGRADSLRYSVRLAGSSFPRSPASAVVSLVPPDAARVPLAIVGAPSRMVAGTSVSLAVTGAEEVTWSVPGGGGHGGVSPDGRFRAPVRPPAPDEVTVTARAPDGRAATASIRILPVVATKPAPLPAPIVTPASPRRALVIAARRRGGVVLATARSTRPGRVRLTLRSGRRRVATCEGRVAPRRPLTCRMRLGRHRRGLRVTAVLTARTGIRTAATRVAPAGRGR